MNKKITAKVFLILLGLAVACRAEQCAKSPDASRQEKADANSVGSTGSPQVGSTCSPQVETILNQLKEKTNELKSYECQIEYLFSQPLLESQTLRKGVLYYQRSGEKTIDGNRSRTMLRINFQTLQQDQDKEQKNIEHYIFDGTWLTHIDYQLKQVKRYQQAEPNEPVDAFDLVGRNFPIIGFTNVDELKNEFEIKPVEQEQQDGLIHLHLKVKLNSTYKNDYTSIDFWVDRRLYLPAKIAAVSAEGDAYRISFIRPEVNKKVDEKKFDFKIPDGFEVETVPRKQKTER